MNERIKELAREAGLLVHNPEGVPTKLDKFAELIVQECMNSLDEQYLYIADDADFSDNKIWISAIMNKTVDGCKRRIQTNFEGCGSMKPGGRSESYSDIMTFLSSVL